ncbi:lipopolysaccharide kinase InaA family protein [Psychroflexus tropicus]|uniref:lipopolysaccharide kinase InaA family protein n=1 Tax=Psychroflexus tropicus TaxID=197345 RepID=UPI0003629BBE|nr:lipopolysaccharide kinase InaA family protein [Psychroflexus tropicus]
MNFKCNPSYFEFKSKLSELINQFDDVGIVFGNGDRNIIKTVEFEGLLLNIKSFKVPNLINQIAYQYFRKSKARRSFEYATLLKEKGIGTPEPIAFFEFSQGLGFGKSFYISEHTTPDLTYRDLVHSPDYPRHEEILRSFTRFTFQLHEHQVEFQDHSPGNTLIFFQENDIKFSLVDLNRMKFKPLNFDQRMYNFRRLTPKKEMVEIMSDEYAKLIKKPKSEVFELMWDYTSEFQRKFHLKQERKKKLKSLF